MEKMKTLTLGDTTFEIVDEQARNDIDELKGAGGGGKSNLLVVTLKTENGNYVSSHTYQEIKAFVENGGDVALFVEGTTTSIFSLASISDTHAFFGKQAFVGQLFVSQGYSVNADGTVTMDQQMIEIPSISSIPTDDHINGLIDAHIEGALGGVY